MNNMTDEIDFSQGERGKFYRPDATFRAPIWLESDIYTTLHQLAEKKGTDIETLINEWLRINISIIETIQ